VGAEGWSFVALIKEGRRLGWVRRAGWGAYSRFSGESLTRGYGLVAVLRSSIAEVVANFEQNFGGPAPIGCDMANLVALPLHRRNTVATRYTLYPSLIFRKGTFS
jgi:hypothetical protein